jgi:hypothetical protein
MHFICFARPFIARLEQLGNSCNTHSNFEFYQSKAKILLASLRKQSNAIRAASSRVACALLPLVLPVWCQAQATFFGPTPYLQQSDTPTSFITGPMNLEDMEDGMLNTQITASGGTILSSSSLTDSVDIDDGVLDGSGVNGKDFFRLNPANITFSFSNRPAAVGLVWTDGQQGTLVSFEAFDLAGVSLGVHGPFALGDANNNGGTAEDRFFGVRNATGVGSITISHTSGGLEIDHIQWSKDDIFANGFE